MPVNNVRGGVNNGSAQISGWPAKFRSPSSSEFDRSMMFIIQHDAMVDHAELQIMLLNTFFFSCEYISHMSVLIIVDKNETDTWLDRFGMRKIQINSMNQKM